MSELTQNNEANWGRTVSKIELLKSLNSPLYEEPTGESKLGEYGAYKGMRVIGRDQRINEGVYLGSGEREEIVVNDVYPEAKKAYEYIYEQLWEKVRSRQKEQEELGQDNNIKNGILSDVFKLVMDEMKYDDAFARQAGVDNKNGLINLSYFINAKKGVCRHQALLVGYLLERLKGEGYIDGEVSIDRNSVAEVGAHAWVRYESSTSGKIYILDPAQEFIGKLEDAPPDWPYRRPEEM
ncbi:MAG: hypothetical protein NTY56_01930 [Patescibacteria group bacterium]|nr:hypothetical protein [Patescibacteria group bacterium]